MVRSVYSINAEQFQDNAHLYFGWSGWSSSELVCSLFVVTITLLLAISESKYILISTIGLALKTNNIQLGRALKNPLAIGAGMVSGMGFGTNTISKMATRVSHELRQLFIPMGRNPRTINRLAGMGDLMLTCFSSQSHNQRCGQCLMKEEQVEDIQKNCTVEGIVTADMAIVYADMCGLELPLFCCVHSLIYKKITPEEAVLDLISRRSR